MAAARRRRPRLPAPPLRSRRRTAPSNRGASGGPSTGNDGDAEGRPGAFDADGQSATGDGPTARLRRRSALLKPSPRSGWRSPLCIDDDKKSPGMPPHPTGGGRRCRARRWSESRRSFVVIVAMGTT